MMGDGVARVFLRALVQLIGGYRVALRMCPGEQITFCRDALLNSRPPALRPFLESMLQLQIFQQFIEERLEMLNSGQVILSVTVSVAGRHLVLLTTAETCILQGFSDEFELEACLYSDKSSKQYKEWLSTMKKESGALFKTVRNKVWTRIDHEQRALHALECVSCSCWICSPGEPRHAQRRQIGGQNGQTEESIGPEGSSSEIQGTASQRRWWGIGAHRPAQTLHQWQTALGTLFSEFRQNPNGWTDNDSWRLWRRRRRGLGTVGFGAESQSASVWNIRQPAALQRW